MTSWNVGKLHGIAFPSASSNPPLLSLANSMSLPKSAKHLPTFAKQATYLPRLPLQRMLLILVSRMVMLRPAGRRPMFLHMPIPNISISSPRNHFPPKTKTHEVCSSRVFLSMDFSVSMECLMSATSVSHRLLLKSSRTTTRMSFRFSL